VYRQNVKIDGRTTSASASVCQRRNGQWAVSSTEPPTTVAQSNGYCPEPGTVVETSVGGWFQFTRGEGPLCWYRTQAGAEDARYAMLLDGDSFWLRQGATRLKDLWPLEPGKRTWFTVTGVTSSGSPSSWYETYTVTGQEQVTVPAGTFDTYVIEWEEQGREGSSYRAVNRFWFAPEIGYFVKFQADPTPYAQLRDWQATRVFVPGASTNVAAHPGGSSASSAPRNPAQRSKR
jgi:hypothetical protein